MNTKKRYTAPDTDVCTAFSEELMVIYDPMTSTNQQLTPADNDTCPTDDDFEPSDHLANNSVWGD